MIAALVGSRVPSGGGLVLMIAAPVSSRAPSGGADRGADVSLCSHIIHQGSSVTPCRGVVGTGRSTVSRYG
jgi:hypothetical protein